MMSCNLRSRASKAWRCAMVASSHRMSEAASTTCARGVASEMLRAEQAAGGQAGARGSGRAQRLTHLQVDPSCSCSGILNWLCAVLPPGMFNAASPEVAHASATLRRKRTAARSRLYTKVFPEPPGPSTKNARACVGAAAPCDAGDLMRRRARAAARSPGGRVQRPQR